MVTIRNVKYVYHDSQYNVDSTDFFSVLVVEDTDFDTVAKRIKELRKDIEEIKVLSFTID